MVEIVEWNEVQTQLPGDILFFLTFRYVLKVKNIIFILFFSLV